MDLSAGNEDVKKIRQLKNYAHSKATSALLYFELWIGRTFV
jgi:hypothetical protein